MKQQNTSQQDVASAMQLLVEIGSRVVRGGLAAHAYAYSATGSMLSPTKPVPHLTIVTTDIRVVATDINGNTAYDDFRIRVAGENAFQEFGSFGEGTAFGMFKGFADFLFDFGFNVGGDFFAQNFSEFDKGIAFLPFTQFFGSAVAQWDVVAGTDMLAVAVGFAFKKIRTVAGFANGSDRAADTLPDFHNVIAADLFHRDAVGFDPGGDVVQHFVAREQHERAPLGLAQGRYDGPAGGFIERAARAGVRHARLDPQQRLLLEIERRTELQRLYRRRAYAIEGIGKARIAGRRDPMAIEFAVANSRRASDGWISCRSVAAADRQRGAR